MKLLLLSQQFQFQKVRHESACPHPSFGGASKAIGHSAPTPAVLLPQPDKNLSYVRACSQSLPCYEVGGDYFDYFDLEGERFCFALGDVAGKGISAALLASKVRGILSAQSFLDYPLPAIISNLNRNLAKRGIGNRFVTFFFGILDAEGDCSYVNAGHNPPVLMHLDGMMKELTEGGVVLGLFPEAHYESRTVKLQPGDHLILFTDGVVEALNVAGEEFGKDRLFALLHARARATAPELLSCLREAVLSFAANTPQHDNITMMILGFRESETPPAVQPKRFITAGSLTPLLSRRNGNSRRSIKLRNAVNSMKL